MSEQPMAPPWVHAIFRPARLAKLALLVGVLALLPYLIQRLPSLASRPEYRLATKQIRIVPAPESPVPANLLDQVREQARLPRELSLLDDKLAADLARAFARHPWIAKVVSVRKSHPATVTVEVKYREPVGMVQVKGGRFPIDASGVVLPPGDFTAADLKRYPTIQGMTPPSSIRPGVAWKDPSLLAAARLAELLAPQWTDLKLESIVVPNRPESAIDSSKIVLELRASGGSKIIWGRAPGTEHPGELTTVQKIGRLEKYLTEFGGFDRPNGPYEIDIRHWQEISRRPLSSGQANSRGNSSSNRTRR
ncbi:MAG: hypothetical protein H7062_05975 [Candidatus Saccharimonas sp.]|nr:hypothetical protein [Planctomycetaceae bacterium]